MKTKEAISNRALRKFIVCLGQNLFGKFAWDDDFD